jgi:hypothetical protein
LAAQTGISQGTVKHAYDMLEQAGIITKTRGSGTFVAPLKEINPGSAKAQAMELLDTFLDKMRDLSISFQDVKIYLDLKIREREEKGRQITVAAVDCSPEALSGMIKQIRTIPHTEVFNYLLDEVLQSPRLFAPETDLVVTTATHYGDLSEKMAGNSRPIQLVMAVATDTALELASLPKDTRLGVITASKRFAQVILKACDRFGKFHSPIKTARFGHSAGIKTLIEECDRIILPQDHQLFSSAEEKVLLDTCKSHPIPYLYQVERGSLLHLREQINQIYSKTN